MKWTLKLVSEVVSGKPTEYEVATIERIEKFSPATVGLTISEGKAILAGLQKQMVTAQVQHHGASIHSCPRCGSRIHPELWRTTTARGNDQHGVRRIDHQPGRQPPVREEAADGLDLARRPSPATDPDEGPERRTGGRIPSMVPAVQSESRVTPDFLMHSITACAPQFQHLALQTDESALANAMPDGHLEWAGARNGCARLACRVCRITS